MKLLGWMHNKFRQNSSETFKDFATGKPSLDDQHHYPRTCYGTTIPFRQGPRDHCQKSFTGLKTTIVEDYEKEESRTNASELFHGFLAIGTLGSDPDIIDTTTFSISIENIAGKETEATKNELKLINDELEKVLGAEVEAKENGYRDSSSRKSHVSTGRNSHASTRRNNHCSTVTLSDKPNEGLEINGNGTSVYPLQGYLFGSAIELSEKTTASKKGHRTSLGELLQKSTIGEENCGPNCNGDEKRKEKEGGKSAVQLMKKILKKKMSNASSRSSAATTNSTSAERKHSKILQMFHKIVHPESSTSIQKFGKPRKIEKKTNMTYDGAHNNERQMLQDDDIVIFPQEGFLKESTRHYNMSFNPSHFTPNNSGSNGMTEHWIKTDADYLVLEL